MLEWLKELHSAQGITRIVEAGGLFALVGIIFAETGLFFGFFLPGDSLLVTAGVLSNPANPHHVGSLEIVTLNLVLVIAAIAGNQVGYIFGHKLGDRIWEWKDSRFYKRRHMEEAHAVFEKWGAFALVGTRFLPILRTFVPIAAGMARMKPVPFAIWNVVGGVVWITSLLWAGYFLGATAWANRLDKLIVIVIFVSFLPIIFGAAARWMKARRPPAA